MNERRTFLSSAAALVVGLVLGQQEKPDDLKFGALHREIDEQLDSGGCFDPPERPGKVVLLCGPTSIRFSRPILAVHADERGETMTLTNKHQGSI
jgi:hypothetical protein